MAVSESFVSPRLVDEAFKARVQQTASVQLWRMIEGVDVNSGDTLSIHLTITTPRGSIVDRRTFRAPERLEK